MINRREHRGISLSNAKKATQRPAISLIAVLLFGVLSIQMHAGNIEVSQRIFSTQSTTVTIGQPEATTTVDLNPKTGTFNDALITDFVYLAVDHHYPVYFGTNMDVKVKLHIEPFDQNNTALPDFYEYLEIKYNPTGTNDFIDKNGYKFTGAYKYIYTIDEILVNNVSQQILPGNLYIDGSIRAERYYDFATQASVITPITGITPTDIDCNTTMDELLITWPVVVGAEEYQLEWTFVNDYDQSATGPYRSASTLNFDFRNNSTRISTVFTNYRVPLLFDHGYVIFRVRAVGVDYQNPGQFIFGVWSQPNTATVASAGSAAYNVTVPHEKDLNWQVTTTFAEEGKKKEVVTYYDGSLRSRQVITRINSDNNVIVGETVYDHQGRPAVTVLPSPVASPVCGPGGENALHFYPNYNQNTNNQGYSRADFDVDGSQSCNTMTPAMGTQSGTSNYYSPQNPDQNGPQAYVPDAFGYPFVRVEYTPDNTGRIRRQGGVGPEFQLDGNHESKYYYGQPTQIQLDRLFGSEVGDASHYKKNIVLDPNGQASVSYLDQEGRVVATALAGDAATNTQAIGSEGTAATTMTADLFNEDANGNSIANVIDVNGEALVFQSQLLVATAGTYSFNYNMNVDTLADVCLNPNICMSCVYDLEIMVVDECGQNLALVNGQPIVKNVGHFTLGQNNELIFDINCSNPTGTNEAITFQSFLNQGSYTVYKILRVNQAAEDFYVAQYLDSTNNNCFKTLNDFQQEFLAAVDTSDCYVDCASCAASLGDRDVYVASGRGTALDYDLAMEACMEPCKVITPCELSYEMMLSDVSPGGQYAEYADANSTVNPAVHALSVLNTSNVLPDNSGGTATWHHPVTDVNGTNYPYYFNDDGTRSVVPVQRNGNVFTPALLNTTANDTFTDPQTGTLYSYPENLSNLTDFIAAWKSSWAKALVQYHPEYCFYETCSQYGEEQTAQDNITSDGFDNLLRTTNTFSAAVTAGFIKTNHLTVNNPTNRVHDWFQFANNRPYDPFVVNSANFGSYSTALQNKFTVYMSYNNFNYSMVEAAAIAARCGNNIGSVPNNACMDFGRDWIPNGPQAVNDSIRDLEWTILKSMYLGEKLKLQNDRGDDVALNSCAALNDCIGEAGTFNPYASGMINPSLFNFGSSPFLDPAQPCSNGTFQLYADKQKRFPDVDDVPQSTPQDAAYQLYLQTGQCPVTFNLQQLLNNVAVADSLDNYGVALMNFPSYASLYLAQTNYQPQAPISTVNYLWNSSVAGDVLSVSWIDTQNGNSVAQELTLDKTNTGIYDWDDIISFSNLHSLGHNGTYYTFSIVAKIVDANSQSGFAYKTLSGTTTLNIQNCMFPVTCTPNDFANDVQLLMTALAANNQLMSTNVNIENAPYTSFVTTQIRAQLAPNNTALRWSWVAADNAWRIFDNNTPSRYVELNIETLDPALYNLNNVRAFSGINSEYQHYFVMQGYDQNNQQAVTVHGSALLHESNGSTSPIFMGECDQPDPMACDGDAYQMREDLEQLLGDVLVNQNVNASIDLYQSPAMTSLLESELPGNVTSTSSSYLSGVAGNQFRDSLDISIGTCNMLLTHRDIQTPQLPMTSIVGVLDLQGMGLADGSGMYHDFYALVTYNVNNINIVDTIFGTSCIGFLNCVPCPDTSIAFLLPLELRDSIEIINNDSLDIIRGRLVRTNTYSSYLDYTAAVDTLNLENGWTPQDTNYVAAVTYPQFSAFAYNQSAETFINFLNNFDTLVDSRTLAAQPDAFVAQYGYAVNVKEEYARYVRATNKYNQRAAAVSLPSITPIVDTIFENNFYAGENWRYIQYLRTQPQNNQPAQDIMAWMTANTTAYNYQDSCAVLYQQYVNAYKLYTIFAALNCPNYQKIAPLYSYEAFVQNNLCCSNAGIVLVNQYIAILTSGTQCAGPLPFLATCNQPGASDDPRACQKLYTLYRQTIDAYNISAYAAAMNHSLPLLYNSFAAFQRAGFCQCIQSYIDYLQPYLAITPNTNLPLPVDLNHFNGCSPSTPLPTDTCKNAYDRYIAAVDQYNQWVFTNQVPGFDPLTSSYTPDQFTAEGYCYCVDAYVAMIDAITSGVYNSNPQDIVLQLYIGRTCKEQVAPPCGPSVAPMDTFHIPEIPYVNPCVEFKINNALANAQLAYEQYMDSMATDFRARYRAHCLGAQEDFNYTYTDKEYHFTLYYYDQSGNLVKTVPPEGVDMLNISTPTSPLELMVKQDRMNGTRTVFTQHRMATLYQYNSLNQLVRQSMPDQDNMDIWETTLPNGLDSRLKITETQFVSSTRGYLSGYLTASNGQQRGYVYTTNDGGATWTRSSSEVGADLHNMQWVSNTEAYAVGEFGTVMKSTDGGNSWDMMPTWNTASAPGTNLTEHLNDLYFTNANNGVVVGENRLMMQTANGGTTWTVINMSSVLNATDDITGITFDGTKYVISVTRTQGNQPLRTMMYSSTNLTAWTAETNIATAANLTNVQLINANDGYACGEDGTLLWTPNGGTYWDVVQTGTAGKFRDVFFRNATEGIAIIENANGEGEIHKTFDGGLTWTLMSQPGQSFNSLYGYEDNANGAKVVAVGDNGLVSRVIMAANTQFGMIDISIPNVTVDLKTAWSMQSGGQRWVYAAGNSGTIYLCDDAENATITWSPISTGLVGLDADVKTITAVNLSANEVNGVLVTQTGKLFSFFKANNATTYTFTQFASPANVNIADATEHPSNYVVAYDNTTNALYRITPVSGVAATNATLISGTNTAGTVNSISARNTNVMLAGNSGKAERAVMNSATIPTATTYTNVNNTLRPAPVRDVTVNGTTVYAAGEDGTVMSRATNGAWTILNSGTAENINDVEFYTSTNAMLACDNGKLFDGTIGANAITTTVVTANTSENLNDVTRSGNAVYVAGDNGTLLVTSNITAGNTVTQTANATTVNLLTVNFRPSATQAIVLGENAHARIANGQNSAHNKQLFAPPMMAVNFTDVNEGYAAGERFTIRHTSDGGLDWEVVAPLQQTTLGTSIPVIHAIYTKANGEAIIAGSDKYVGLVNATTNISDRKTINGATNACTFYDVDVIGNNAVIVGGQGANGRYVTSTNAGTTWNAAVTVNATNLRTVNAFNRANNFTWIVAGSNSYVRYFDGTTLVNTVTNNIPSGVTFNESYFHDDLTGYLVGNNGTVLRSENFAFNPATGVYTAGSWTSKAANDGLNNHTTNSNLNITSIAFSDRYSGFIGGDYNNSVQTNATADYARRLNDESNNFSTRFWYDKLGRIVVSQNSRQYVEPNGKRYSYTTYDALGRVEEAGEKAENTSGAAFASVFGTNVNNFFNPKVIDDANLNAWINNTSGQRTEVTHTYYDAPNATIAAALPGNFSQENLRKRVSCVVYEEVWDNNDGTYSHATHYTYDIHGNVNTLLQDNPNTGVAGQEFKRLDYAYDLISGNVNEVVYQEGELDMMIHRYEYDSDNRITSVETSTDGVFYDNDAKYFYYAHGPLARTELGENQVQGLDYVYTLQGWIKGVNSNSLDTTRDIGQDGNRVVGNPNAYFAKDVFGYTLNYFAGDYTAINSTVAQTPNNFEADKTNSDLLTSRKDFFNGNISAMVTTITNPTTGEVLPQGMAYDYDQLNRFLSAKAFVNLDMQTNTWQSGSTYANRYYNAFTYDANGNILTQTRYAENGTQIESFLLNFFVISILKS